MENNIYFELCQQVPGVLSPPSSLPSPGNTLECQVPSPSTFIDFCRSPPSSIHFNDVLDGKPTPPTPPLGDTDPPCKPEPLQEEPEVCQDLLQTLQFLALQHTRKEIEAVAEALAIHRDPSKWAIDDVRKWLCFQAAQLQLPPLMLHYWNLCGSQVLLLTEMQFRELAPFGGEQLYAKLEIWKETQSGAAEAVQHVELLQEGQKYGGDQVFRRQEEIEVQDTSLQLQQIVKEESKDEIHMQLNLQSQQQQQQFDQQPMLLKSATTNYMQQQQASSIPCVSPSSASPTSDHIRQQPLPDEYQHQLQLLDSDCDHLVTVEEQKQPATPMLQTPPHSPDSGIYSMTENMESDGEDASEIDPPVAPPGGRGGSHIHLWQFLKELLQQPDKLGSHIRWLDRSRGIFKIEDSVRVAKLWGRRKNRPAMNYDKLSRSIRQYYKKGIMKKTERSQRLVYQFCHPYSIKGCNLS